MYKKIRKSVVDAIASVEGPEHFEWNKWLKEPQIYLERFPTPRTDIKNVENFQAFSEPTLYQVKKFTLTKFKVSEEIKNIIAKKRKTFKIFFSFPKPYQQKLSIFDSNIVRLLFELSIFYKDKELFVKTKKDSKESVTKFNPKIILKKPTAIKVSVTSNQANIPEVDFIKKDCHLLKPKLLDYSLKPQTSLKFEQTFNSKDFKVKTDKKEFSVAFNKLEKIPSLKKIPVITLAKIKKHMQMTGEKAIRKLPIDALDQIPKHHLVKFVQLEPMKEPLIQVRNLQPQIANQKLFKFDGIEKTVRIGKNLSSQLVSELNVTKSEIVSQLLPKEVEEVKVKPTKEAVSVTTKKNEVKTQTLIWEEIEADFMHLFAHQKEGVQLLLTNKTALLNDELGIDKKTQAIYALDAAIEHGQIKNALIVCPDSHIGNKKVSEHLKNSDGWENQIIKVNPELNFVSIRGNDKKKILESFEKADIQIVNYINFIELTSDPSREHFKEIDCLILDEAQYFLNNEIEPELLFNFPAIKYKWILTSSPSQMIEERLVPKLNNHLPDFEKLDGYLNRTKESLGSKLPHIVRNDFWHELDVEQSQEFENTLLQGRKRITDLLKGGNPFIIQSNIFTLIHQIKQLGNFSSHKVTSSKSELLLDQLESIIASGQKSILFSQYDKQGIQKIEQLLKNNQIKYVLYQSGMPLKELENSANKFKKESKISVMLAGLTAASVKVRIPEASYLIHFDQWWNPINQWQYEDKSLNDDDHNQSTQSVNVINYFGNNSVEINIRETLQKKGLLIKNLIEFLSNETIYSLISNEDWLDILGIEHTRSRKNALPDIESMMDQWSQASVDEIGQKTKLLFNRLGYKNLMLKPDMLHEEINIYGFANKSLHEIKTAILCLPFNMKDVEPVQNFINYTSKNNSRMFVVCSDETAKQMIPDPHERVIYIGQELFVNYLAQFKIS